MYIRNKKIPLPGYRIIKTSIAVFLTLIIYQISGRDLSLIALTSALICMEDSTEKSVTSGVNRLISTVIGGVFGLGVFALRNMGLDFIPWSLLSCFGLMIFIYFLNLMSRTDSIILGSVVYLVIVLDPHVSEPFIYAINRVIDTGIGIGVSVFVNHFFFKNTHDRSVIKINANEQSAFRYKVKRNANHKTRNWNGGISTELLIYPKKSVYQERNFKWRISTATTDYRETKFTTIPNYERHMILLSGNVKFVQKDNVIKMNRYDMNIFDAGVDTECLGLSTDFKLMVSKYYEGFINKNYADTTYDIKKYNLNNQTYELKTLYSLFDEVNLLVCVNPTETFEVALNKGDLFILENIDKIPDEQNSFITVTCEGKTDKDIVCISTSVRKK